MADTSASPALELFVERWHLHLRGKLEGGLDVLLDDDVVFKSPIVFTPQEGKDITKMYLLAAGGTLGGDGAEHVGINATDAASTDGEWDGRFRYVRTIREGNDVLLEFETKIDGKYVNGIDLITVNDESKIVSFTVMVRPLQAINLLHAQMKAALEQLNAL